MTREQYEKLKEWVKAEMLYAVVRTPSCSDDCKEREKELDKLMFPEGNEG